MMEPETKTLLKAIRAKCLECSGGHRDEVEHCKLDVCALHPYRSDKAPRKKAGSESMQGDLLDMKCGKNCMFR